MGESDNIPDDAQEHWNVLIDAERIYEERSLVYGDVWKQYGALNNLVRAATKIDRLMAIWWHNQDDFEGFVTALHKDGLDDAYDAINYLAFFVRCAKNGNVTGSAPVRPQAHQHEFTADGNEVDGNFGRCECGAVSMHPSWQAPTAGPIIHAACGGPLIPGVVHDCFAKLRKGITSSPYISHPELSDDSRRGMVFHTHQFDGGSDVSSVSSDGPPHVHRLPLRISDRTLDMDGHYHMVIWQ
jgi:hypothetical protein